MPTSSHRRSGPNRSRNRGSRSRRRADAHLVAHGEAVRNEAPEVPDHPLIPVNTPDLITTAAALQKYITHVRDVGRFAFDTEFIGEESYVPKTCLIQLATSESVALIDPLDGLNVDGVWELIADPELETIVHAGQQDFEPVVRRLGRTPANIFDTQIVAAFVNRPYPLSLRHLVEEFIGVAMPKGLTFTSWDRRPLSKVHARYAADDVRYLPALREILGRQLEELDHTAWAAEECAALTSAASFEFNPAVRAQRLIGNRYLGRRNVAVLRELLAFRNATAEAMNIPRRTLLRDDVLVRMAKDPTRKLDRLDGVKGLPRPIISNHGEALLAAIERAYELPHDDLPPAANQKESPAERVRIDSLWSLICSYCLGRSINPTMAASRRDIARFYFDSIKETPSGDPPFANGWRREVIGRVLSDLLADGASIRFEWTDEHLRAVTDQ